MRVWTEVSVFIYLWFRQCGDQCGDLLLCGEFKGKVGKRLTVAAPGAPCMLPVKCSIQVLQQIKEERNRKEGNNYHFLMPREIPISINI